MFVPRQPWEYLLAKLAVDKEAAKTYEQYFNDIISNVRDKGNFQQVSVSKDTIKDSYFTESNCMCRLKGSLYIKEMPVPN